MRPGSINGCVSARRHAAAWRWSGLAKAFAVMRGRGYIVPDDVATVAVPALAHRVLVVDGAGSTAAGRDVVIECLGRVRPPSV